MTTEQIKADYSSGRKPVFLDLRGIGHGYVALENGSRISIDRLVDLRDRVLEVIPNVDAEDELKTEHFYLAVEWDAMSNSCRRMLGMALVYLIDIGAIHLECTNPCKSGTKKYRLKQ